MVTLLLFISIILALIVGWLSRPVFLYLVNRNRVRLQRRHGVKAKPGESASDQYQKYKENKLNLKPIPAPVGTSPDAVIRFNKLSPEVQRKVIAARKERGLDG